MKPDHIQTIRKLGHWRVNIRPIGAPPEVRLIGDCRRIVEESSVSVRGWDYPHISRRNDEQSGSEQGPNYFQSWINWEGFIEFWRIYRSSQFLSLNALREDTRPGDHGNPRMRVLNVVGAIYQVTEIFDFSQILFVHGLYRDEVECKLSLINTRGRILQAGVNRVPFFEHRAYGGDELTLLKVLSPSTITEDYRRLAAETCIELFDLFGWNPDLSQIEADQERFYRRDWAY